MLSSSPKASGTVAPSYSYQLPFIRRPFRRLASSFEILHQRAFLALPLSDRQCGGPCLASPDLHMTVLRSTRAGPNCSAEPVASLPIAISVQGQEPRRNISRPKRYLCGYESLAVLLILSHEPRFVLAIMCRGQDGKICPNSPGTSLVSLPHHVRERTPAVVITMCHLGETRFHVQRLLIPRLRHGTSVAKQSCGLLG